MTNHILHTKQSLFRKKSLNGRKNAQKFIQNFSEISNLKLENIKS